MRIILRMLLITPLFFFIAYAGNQSNKAQTGKMGESVRPSNGAYQKITPAQAKAMINGDLPYILLDVRTEEEFNEKRIDGAILIPDYAIRQRAEAELPDKEALILIYCRSGRRSEIAARALVDMGYANVYDFGGIIDWPYETTGR